MSVVIGRCARAAVRRGRSSWGRKAGHLRGVDGAEEKVTLGEFAQQCKRERRPGDDGRGEIHREGERQRDTANECEQDTEGVGGRQWADEEQRGFARRGERIVGRFAEGSERPGFKREFSRSWRREEKAQPGRCAAGTERADDARAEWRMPKKRGRVLAMRQKTRRVSA